MTLNHSQIVRTRFSSNHNPSRTRKT